MRHSISLLFMLVLVTASCAAVDEVTDNETRKGVDRALWLSSKVEMKMMVVKYITEAQIHTAMMTLKMVDGVEKTNNTRTINTKELFNFLQNYYSESTPKLVAWIDFMYKDPMVKVPLVELIDTYFNERMLMKHEKSVTKP